MGVWGFEDAGLELAGGCGEVAADEDVAAVAGEALEDLVVERCGKGDGLLCDCRSDKEHSAEEEAEIHE